MNKYIHGYSDDEANRLHDQADSLADLLHYDSVWEEGSIILEAGCGNIDSPTTRTDVDSSTFSAIR